MASDNGRIEETLQSILQQLKTQKNEVTEIIDTKLADKLSEIKEEVQGHSRAVQSEVKKLKADSEYTWSKQGNKAQYTFNTELNDIIVQSVWAIEHNKLDYANEVLSSALDKLKQRNKLIKLADSSEAGWETAKQYLSNPIASDSDDESKIVKAERRAFQVRKRKQQKRKKPASSSSSRTTSGSYPNSGFVPAGLPTAPVGGSGNPFQQPWLFPSANSQRQFRSPAGPINYGGCCFACGQFDHFRRNCPYTKSQPLAQTPRK